MPYTAKQRRALQAIAGGAKLGIMRNVSPRKAKRMLGHSNRSIKKALA